LAEIREESIAEHKLRIAHWHDFKVGDSVELKVRQCHHGVMYNDLTQHISAVAR
jgi:hypothetical protein